MYSGEQLIQSHFESVSLKQLAVETEYTQLFVDEACVKMMGFSALISDAISIEDNESQWIFEDRIEWSRSSSSRQMRLYCQDAELS